MEKEMTVRVLPQMITVSHGQNVELTIENLIVSNKPEYALEIEVTGGSFRFAVGQLASNSFAVYNRGEGLKVVLRREIRRIIGLKLNFIASPDGGSFKINL